MMGLTTLQDGFCLVAKFAWILAEGQFCLSLACHFVGVFLQGRAQPEARHFKEKWKIAYDGALGIIW